MQSHENQDESRRAYLSPYGPVMTLSKTRYGLGAGSCQAPVHPG